MASVNLFLDTRDKNKQGGYPVKLRICHNRKQWAVGIKTSLTPADFDRVMADKGRISSELKDVRDKVFGEKKRAEGILRDMRVVTPDGFRQLFFADTDSEPIGNRCEMRHQFQLYINELRDDDKIKTAMMYGHALRSFVAFRGNVMLQDVDDKYLGKYETWMERNGRSVSTASMYLRSLRCIYNRAIRFKALHERFYPFKDYSCASNVKTKDALYPEQVQAWWQYVPENSAQDRYKDYWFFAYCCSGMNMRDICDLRWRQIQGDRLTFYRSKTSRTNKSSKEIVVFLNDEAKAIIGKHGSKTNQPDEYVFPIFQGAKTEVERVDRLMFFQRSASRVLHRIGVKLGFDTGLKLGIARHSFATRLKMDGVNTASISEMLGHSSQNVTEHYLASIPMMEQKRISGSLLKF